MVSADYVPALKGKDLKYSLFTMIPNAHMLLDACMNVGVQDCFTAVNFLINNAATLSIDPARIVLAGAYASAKVLPSSRVMRSLVYSEWKSFFRRSR